jgi:hypothetical protein
VLEDHAASGSGGPHTFIHHRHEALTDDLADLRVASRGVGLELEHELRRVSGDQLAHRRFYAVEGKRPTSRIVGVGRGLKERLAQALHSQRMAGQEQVLLVGEQGIDVGLRDANAFGDIGSSCGEIAVGGELGECSGEDVVAALGG